MIDAAFEALDAEFDPQRRRPDRPLRPRRRPRGDAPPARSRLAGDELHLRGLPAGRPAGADRLLRGGDDRGGPRRRRRPTPPSPPITRSSSSRTRIGSAHEDVIDLWSREGAVPPGEAERRVDEVHPRRGPSARRPRRRLERLPPAQPAARDGPLVLPRVRRQGAPPEPPGSAARDAGSRPPRGALRERRGPARGGARLRGRESRAQAGLQPGALGAARSSPSSARTSAGTTSASATSRAAGRPTRPRRTLTTEASAYSVATSHGRSGPGVRVDEEREEERPGSAPGRGSDASRKKRSAAREGASARARVSSASARSRRRSPSRSRSRSPTKPKLKPKTQARRSRSAPAPPRRPASRSARR